MMTHDEICAVVQAHKKGQRIEWRRRRAKTGGRAGASVDGGDWLDSHPALAPMLVNICCHGFIYRPKPEPKLRPWKPGEVPLGAIVRRKYYHSRGESILWVIVSAAEEYVWLGHAAEAVTTEALFTGDFEHSTDGGKTWKPCGVEE